MKKALMFLLCAGTVFLVMAEHPFETSGAVFLGDREFEVEISGGTDFIKERTGNVKIGLNYGIGDRFQIGMDNFWFDEKDSNSFSVPDLTMMLAIRPDFIAIKATSAFNGSEFGGFLLYTIKLKKMGTALNLDLGFESDGTEKGSFAWAYSVVQPLNNSFFGAEIYGNAANWLNNDEMKPLWQIGLGHNFTRRKNHIASIGFGGSFISNDDLKITLGVTYLGGKNKESNEKL